MKPKACNSWHLNGNHFVVALHRGALQSKGNIIVGLSRTFDFSGRRLDVSGI